MDTELGNPKVRGPQEAVAKGSMVTIKTMVKHPMESGLRKDKDTGQTIPAYFIQKVEATYLGQPVMKAEWTGAVSRNPFFSFNLKATATGPVVVTWTDNQGGTWNDKTELKVM
ncbi:MAG: thiosulfate oxidation carrier complex protein SoxZ [Magnetococcales bacterium]|nr:thiosulfate oxidation carrier complex protein SoxZ [Magnetococcales bacterium]